MIPVAGYTGQRVGVFGMGRSGLAAARALRAGGAVPVCWDDAELGRKRAASAGFAVADLSDPAEARSLFKLVLSPGAPHLFPAPHPAAAAALAAGVPVDNDVGLFFEAVRARNALSRREAPHRVIAITGTNGKSTTAALTHHLLREAGFDSQLGGNIGRGVLDLDGLPPGGVTVLELSSYQTDVARGATPDVAALTNLQPDHLDRHGGLGGYFAAKAKLFGAPTLGTAVVGVNDVCGRWLANRLEGPHARERLWRVAASTAALQRRGQEILADDARLTILRDGVGAVLADLSSAEALRGRHNWENAAVAAVAALALGVDRDAVRSGLERFPGLAHRMQKIRAHLGVAYVNDSKATNADAAEKALRSFDRIRWIAGGRAKEGGLAALAPALGSVLKAYLIGECAAAFAAELDAAGVAHEIPGDMERAVAAAIAEARPGDTVLLSPAAASFDQFPDFEARGDAFARAVDAVLGPA